MASLPRISCVICAYNEADRIENILDAVSNHPSLIEVIVVNDGSTDATEEILRTRTDIILITYTKNKGKTFAMSEGIAAAQGELVMLLDADLLGLTSADIDALAQPVLAGVADVSMSLRRNSLWIYRQLGIDFVTGERVIPRSLLIDAVQAMQALPHWGGEVFMNSYFLKHKLRIAVVRWHTVYNIRKYDKVGIWRGIGEELRMIYDAFHVLTLWDTCTQILALLWYKVPEHQLSSVKEAATLPSI